MMVNMVVYQAVFLPERINLSGMNLSVRRLGVRHDEYGVLVTRPAIHQQLGVELYQGMYTWRLCTAIRQCQRIILSPECGYINFFKLVTTRGHDVHVLRHIHSHGSHDHVIRRR